MTVYVVSCAGPLNDSDDGFLSLFIPAIAASYKRIGLGAWCVTSILTADQIMDRLTYWTAGKFAIDVTAQDAVHLFAQPKTTWQSGQMLPPASLAA
jgi:hypothetical protein